MGLSNAGYAQAIRDFEETEVEITVQVGPCRTEERPSHAV